VTKLKQRIVLFSQYFTLQKMAKIKANFRLVKGDNSAQIIPIYKEDLYL
jgi:hypothetical protein